MKCYKNSQIPFKTRTFSFLLFTFSTLLIQCQTVQPPLEPSPPDPKPNVTGVDHRPDECGAPACSIERAEFLKSLYAMSDIPLDSIRVFRVQAHIIQDTLGNSLVDVSAIQEAFDNLNKSFIGSGLYFELAREINVANSPLLLHEMRSDRDKEDLVTQNINIPGQINIYFVKTATPLLGYTPVLQDRFEDYEHISLNKMFIASKAVNQNATIAHEFGHFFSLQHTFGINNLEASTNELPDGSNCATSGDFICDTPADPSGQIDCCNCSYTGLIGQSTLDYKPLVNNFMSYYKWCCRNAFTPGQLQAMRKAGIHYRWYLK